MNKESVEIINRLRAILQDSWVNELQDTDKKDFLAVLEDSSYYLGKHCRYCGQALDLSPVEKFKKDLRIIEDNE